VRFVLSAGHVVFRAAPASRLSNDARRIEHRARRVGISGRVGG
jgi:hypothetical protein